MPGLPLTGAQRSAASVCISESRRVTTMPIFEYHCLVCNRDFEKLVRTSATEVECTNCGSELLEKKFSLFGSKVGARSPDLGGGGGGGGGGCGCGSCSCQS
jgi:putative FmdB family regulatory protein